MKSLEELKKIRERMLNQTNNVGANAGKDIRVVVGMATCGIAAGARETLKAFLEEIEHNGLVNIAVMQTGCIGMCKYEPIVEVISADGKKITYIEVTKEKVSRIVQEHLKDGNIVRDFLIK